MKCSKCREEFDIGDRCIVFTPREHGGLGVYCFPCAKRTPHRYDWNEQSWSFITDDGFVNGGGESTWEQWMERH